MALYYGEPEEWRWQPSAAIFRRFVHNANTAHMDDYPPQPWEAYPYGSHYVASEVIKNPRYLISPEGRIVDDARDADLTHFVHTSGYPGVLVHPWNNTYLCYVLVHQLVAWRWVGPRPSPEHVCRHLDDNKLNPHAWNLAWGRAEDNWWDTRINHERGGYPYFEYRRLKSIGVFP